MKKFIHKIWLSFVLAFFLLCVGGISTYAVNDPVEKNKDEAFYSEIVNTENFTVEAIDAQLDDIESILDESALTYDEFVVKYPEKTLSASLNKAEVVNSIQSTDAPLGINGFFWGFCLTWVGILLVYLLMEDSPNRSKQVRNAVYGCVTIGVLYILFWVVFAVILGTGTGIWWWL